MLGNRGRSGRPAIGDGNDLKFGPELRQLVAQILRKIGLIVGDDRLQA